MRAWFGAWVVACIQCHRADPAADAGSSNGSKAAVATAAPTATTTASALVDPTIVELCEGIRLITKSLDDNSTYPRGLPRTPAPWRIAPFASCVMEASAPATTRIAMVTCEGTTSAGLTPLRTAIEACMPPLWKRRPKSAVLSWGFLRDRWIYRCSLSESGDHIALRCSKTWSVEDDLYRAFRRGE